MSAALTIPVRDVVWTPQRACSAKHWTQLVAQAKQSLPFPAPALRFIPATFSADLPAYCLLTFQEAVIVSGRRDLADWLATLFLVTWHRQFWAQGTVPDTDDLSVVNAPFADTSWRRQDPPFWRSLFQDALSW